MGSTKQVVEELLAKADILLNGDRPWDIQVNNEALYKRFLGSGNLGLGEAYMDGWWDCDQIDEMIFRFLRMSQHKDVTTWKIIGHVVKSRITNVQRSAKAFEIGEKHYDVGNDLYERMLDDRMTYTCGYWKDIEHTTENLNAAQEAKLDLICRKIGLTKGMKVLDIGCGWGSFAQYAAEKYGAEVVGVTVSKEQVALGNKRCEGLPVEIRFQDYRDIGNEQFDRIVSVGMFEHVGYKNYGTFMKECSRLLKDDGLLLLHTIGRNWTVKTNDTWIDKYIFPNSMLPSVEQIGRSIGKQFIMEDWHNFGAYYDPTLLAWWDNFDSTWNEIEHQYSERFYRMWKYYILSCAGSFRARRNQLWQIVLSKNGVPSGYDSIR